MGQIDEEMEELAHGAQIVADRLTHFVRTREVPEPQVCVVAELEEAIRLWRARLDPQARPTSRDFERDGVRLFGGPRLRMFEFESSAIEYEADGLRHMVVLVDSSTEMTIERAAIIYAYMAWRRAGHCAVGEMLQGLDDR